MAQKIDLKLAQDSENVYDISFASTGDFAMVEGFDTTVLMSIFCERRASPSEVPDAIRRRGWIGNVLSDTPGFEIGSKFWLFWQERLTNNTINGAKDAILDGLQWFVDDGVLEKIEANVANTTTSIGMGITTYASGSRVESRYYTLWELTGR